MKTRITGEKGVTFVELLIYIAIFLTVSTFLVSILIVATRNQSRESAAAEITQQMDFVLQNIQRYVQESSNIDMPAGTATSTLTLRTKADSTDPIKIFANSTNTAIYLKQGTSGAETALTSDRIRVGNFVVTKYENPGGHATVQVEMTLNFNTSTAPKFSDVSRTLRTAIARVSAATFDSALVPASGALDVGLTGTRWRDAFFSGKVGIGSVSPDPGLEINGTNIAVSLNENSATPNPPDSGTEVRIYMKSDKIIFQYNDAGTVRYKYLDLTGTGVTWVASTTAP